MGLLGVAPTWEWSSGELGPRGEATICLGESHSLRGSPLFLGPPPITRPKNFLNWWFSNPSQTCSTGAEVGSGAGPGSGSPTPSLGLSGSLLICLTYEASR